MAIRVFPWRVDTCEVQDGWLDITTFVVTKYPVWPGEDKRVSTGCDNVCIVHRPWHGWRPRRGRGGGQLLIENWLVRQ